MTSQPDAEPFDPSQITFVTRRVTPSEAAAVTAVLSGLLMEQSNALHSRPGRAPSAWSTSQRSVRAPLVPGAGAWRSFSG